ncbi:uncharacterized protein BX663DRAFT_527313 [Cokeromyces recurvatus]|uniref:uncharacterized protein n=1 Tax=Cokeromyces recurvatus TaxID=90255 RepID=UPI00221E7345|nr:uncharacterized protein BX663DRAFT_527313 [Cokeromyces recurvatus]KAI7897718.1 hypothetical protein BX663DRAFT_527313 [Cokeromyces recurvatus]
MSKDSYSSNNFSLKRLLDEQTNSTNKRKKASISLSKSRPISPSSVITVKQEIKIKTEKVKADTIDDYIIKKEEEIKLESKDDLLNDIKLETVKDETDIFDQIKLEEELDTFIEKENKYACPICDKDLTLVKSSYFRQQHIDECISNTQNVKEKLEFDICIFCGKDLTHLDSLTRRQVHLNRCLDESMVPEQEQQQQQQQTEIFAGQDMPLLVTLEICPICYESFMQRGLRQKIVHLKQCAKQNQITVPELLKRIQYPNEGNVSKTNEMTAPTPQRTQYQLVATGYDLDDDFDDDNDDFSRKVIIHKQSVSPMSQKKQDKEDEAFQTALALSRSLHEERRQKQRLLKRRQKMTDERDWNAANIWSAEESYLKAMDKLDKILFPSNMDHYKQVQRERSIGLLGPSRINHSNNNFFWHIASNKESNWDDPLVFMSLFTRKFKEF